jgi:hypothetical protein
VKSLKTTLLFLLLTATIPACSLKAQLRAGVAAIPITPFGPHPDWKGAITESGVWGNDQHRIWLAGFGSNRPALGKHDDLWARALVLGMGPTKVALVALDFIGYYQNAGYYGVDQVMKQLKPGLGLTAVIVASTHNHEGPDTIGLWAPANRDGKYEEYLKWVDRRIAEAISLAADPGNMTEVRARFGVTNPQRSPSLQGLQVRTSHRPPEFFDEELRVMQLVKPGGLALATLVNWNTHPESQESRNQQLTSDFPHFVRQAIEEKYGGTAVYFSGDLGAVEIVGDAVALGMLDYEMINGRHFPIDPKSRRPNISFERTKAIGDAVAAAVFQVLASTKDEKVDTLTVKSLKITAPVTNPGYIAMIHAKVLANFSGDDDHPRVDTTLYHLRVGPADFITLPGEVFPEIIYGVEAHKRTGCPENATGRPYEPPVMPLLKEKYHFIIGLAPDELGYVVPQYDFTPFPPKPMPLEGRAPDACKSQGVPDHYHETNSASYRMAPVIACGLVDLLGGKALAYEACK